MNYNLKYLYRAIYRNGTHYDQNAEDISVTDPNKSCYHDLKIDQIQYFVLSDGISTYSLNLDDGSITINEAKFYLAAEPLTDFKLQYFRRVVLNINNASESMIINYILGYTAKDMNGQTVSHSIVVR